MSTWAPALFFAHIRALTLITLLSLCGHSVAQQPSSVTFSPAIEITAGGKYSGNWESQDPSVPAVLVSTTAPVVIENCNIQSKSDLLSAHRQTHFR